MVVYVSDTVLFFKIPNFLESLTLRGRPNELEIFPPFLEVLIAPDKRWTMPV